MEILHTSRDFVVCLKPTDMDSQHQLPAALRETVGGEIYPVHRLDANVGGVMVYARNPAAAAELSRAIADGAMEKEYVAMVHGTPPESGELTDLLFKDSRKNKVYVVKRLRAGVREARLSYQRLRAGERSLVRVHLDTGRSHQIRVQLASRGFPLVGDHKYGSRGEEKAPLLYSCCIAFPFRGENYRFEALPPWAE